MDHESPVNIFVVDDNDLNRAILIKAIKTHHPAYNIFQATSGKELFELLSHISPDLILLDVMMPDVDGFEICRRIKENEKYRDTPIILVTALVDNESKIKGFKAGATDYISKPVSFEETIARVQVHLRIKQYQDKLKEALLQLEFTQNSLIEHAKMSALGSLSAAVSHEFNNILTMVSGFTKLSERENDIDKLRETMAIIRELIERGKYIVKGMLDFARNEKDEDRYEADLTELIDHDLVLMGKIIRDADINIVKEFDGDCRRCFARRAAFHRCF